MNLFETFLWYLENIFGYTIQMLPCMSVALVLFLLLWPVRKRRLERLDLFSSSRREGALLLFVMFSAGLASLTLFPANLWSYVLDRLFRPQEWAVIWAGRSPASFYPSWEEIVLRTQDLADLINPLQEIRRALRGGPWVFFMMLGNIGMFLPIGFFPALLWRRPRWWKSILSGLASSVTIEFVQFFIGRSTDIDDVFLNTAGAMLGFWVFGVINALFPQGVSKFQCCKRGAVSEWTI